MLRSLVNFYSEKILNRNFSKSLNYKEDHVKDYKKDGAYSTHDGKLKYHETFQKIA
jgi:hypothetical protein